MRRQGIQVCQQCNSNELGTGQGETFPVLSSVNKWSTEVNVKIDTVDPTATPPRPIIKVVAKKTRVFDVNLQKKVLPEYHFESKIKQQEWAKHIANKKVLMTLISGQCDDATLTELALGTTYEVDCNKGNLIQFLDRLKLICYESDNGGLSHKPYKVVVPVKSLRNFINPREDNPHGFKEEVKVKYNATMAIVG